MNRDEFAARLAERPLLLDGAMGAWIHAKGVTNDTGLDSVNVQNPSIVAEIHREYINVGADIIETNSFAANRFKLAEHGLQNETVAINQAAVDVARRVIASSFKPVLLAGSRHRASRSIPVTDLKLSLMSESDNYCHVNLPLSGLRERESRDLLRDQPDEKDDDRGTENQHAHVGEAACGDERISVVSESANKEQAADWQEHFQRRIKRGDLENDCEESQPVANRPDVALPGSLLRLDRHERDREA